MRKVLSILMAVVILLSLCACQQNEPNEPEIEATTPETTAENTTVATEETTIPTVAMPTTFTVVLTPENFGEYFEVYYAFEFEENAFGDISINPSSGMWGIRLKPIYEPYINSAVDVVAEIIYSQAVWNAEIDYENKIITPLTNEGILYEECAKIVEFDCSNNELEAYVMFLYLNEENKILRYPTDLVVSRAKGTLIFTNTEDFPVTENTMPPTEKQDNQSVETEKIELTMENWDTYFEFVEVPIFFENAFGEMDSFTLEYKFKLKDEYFQRLDNSKETSVTVEFSYSHGERYCAVDYETQTYSLGDFITTHHSTLITDNYIHDNEEYYFTGFTAYPAYSGDRIITNFDFEVLRIQGTLNLFAE